MFSSGLWTCLFTCMAFPVQISGVTPSKEATMSCVDTGRCEVENAMEDFEKGCTSYCKNPKRFRRTLEDTLLKVNFGGYNLTVEHSGLQTLIFKIHPGDFRGLNVSSDILKDEKNSSLLNDDIVGANLGNISISNLSQPVEVRFWHNYTLANSSVTCVFWLEGTEEDGHGNWSSDGCKTVNQKGIVLCQCYHLTYFAVLLQISPVTVDEALLAPLTYLTVIGCSISASACLITIFLYICSRKMLHNTTTKIHINLLGALFFLNTSFLISEPLGSINSQQWLCKAAAVFLHYSLLCCLTWMAIEGFHLYMLVIKVYNSYIRRYLLKLCSVGWGLPGLAVTIIVLIKREIYDIHDVRTNSAYNNRKMCWISPDYQIVHNINLILLGSIILFNMIILAMVVQRLRHLRANPHQQEEHSCKDMVTVLGLTVVLGATWTSAFISFGVFSIAQIFLFTILNSLQGVFICLWYCALRCHSQASISIGISYSSQ